MLKNTFTVSFFIEQEKEKKNHENESEIDVHFLFPTNEKDMITVSELPPPGSNGIRI